jgi:hypothetical protein
MPWVPTDMSLPSESPTVQQLLWRLENESKMESRSASMTDGLSAGSPGREKRKSRLRVFLGTTREKDVQNTSLDDVEPPSTPKPQPRRPDLLRRRSSSINNLPAMSAKDVVSWETPEPRRPVAHVVLTSPRVEDDSHAAPTRVIHVLGSLESGKSRKSPSLPP